MDTGLSRAEAEELLAARRPEAPAFEIWPENLECVALFRELETQWRYAATFAGVVRTGLIYTEATNLMKEQRIPRARRLELLEDLRAMERAALSAFGGGDEGADG